MNARWAAQYRTTADYYAHFFDQRMTAETPDAQFNVALRWRNWRLIRRRCGSTMRRD